jgi:hypothetical protein
MGKSKADHHEDGHNWSRLAYVLKAHGHISTVGIMLVTSGLPSNVDVVYLS